MPLFSLEESSSSIANSSRYRINMHSSDLVTYALNGTNSKRPKPTSCRLKTDAEQTRSILWRCETSLGLAKVAWARGEFEVAFDEVERAIDFAGQTSRASLVRFARAHLARFWLAAGQLALARRWAESCDLDPFLPPNSYEAMNTRRLCACSLRKINRDLLSRYSMQSAMTQKQKGGRYGNLLEVLVLQSLAYKRLGEHGDARGLSGSCTIDW